MDKTFDAVAWMRKRRTEIDQQDQGLSWGERFQKTRKMLEADPLWKRFKGCVSALDRDRVSGRPH